MEGSTEKGPITTGGGHGVSPIGGQQLPEQGQKDASQTKSTVEQALQTVQTAISGGIRPLTPKEQLPPSSLSIKEADHGRQKSVKTMFASFLAFFRSSGVKSKPKAKTGIMTDQDLQGTFDKLANRSDGKIYGKILGDKYVKQIEDLFNQYLIAKPGKARFQAGEALSQAIKREYGGFKLIDPELAKVVRHLKATIEPFKANEIHEDRLQVAESYLGLKGKALEGFYQSIKKGPGESGSDVPRFRLDQIRIQEGEAEVRVKAIQDLKDLANLGGVAEGPLPAVLDYVRVMAKEGDFREGIMELEILHRKRGKNSESVKLLSDLVQQEKDSRASGREFVKQGFEWLKENTDKINKGMFRVEGGTVSTKAMWEKLRNNELDLTSLDTNSVHALALVMKRIGLYHSAPISPQTLESYEKISKEIGPVELGQPIAKEKIDNAVKKLKVLINKMSNDDREFLKLICKNSKMLSENSEVLEKTKMGAHQYGTMWALILFPIIGGDAGQKAALGGLTRLMIEQSDEIFGKG